MRAHSAEKRSANTSMTLVMFAKHAIGIMTLKAHAWRRSVITTIPTIRPKQKRTLITPMKTKIGSITLKRSHCFTQYSESAAYTDYVTCEPQTVDLFRYDDGYWIGAVFQGILTATTFNDAFHIVGSPKSAFCQTQAFGGIDGWIDSELFTINLNADWTTEKVGNYESGKPIFALHKRQTETVALH